MTRRPQLDGSAIRIMHPAAADRLECPPSHCLAVNCKQPTAYRATLAPLPDFDTTPVTFVCVEHAPLMRELHNLVQIRSFTA